MRQTVSVSRPDDKRLSFNGAAETYDQVRPSYPPDLFDTLFDFLPRQPRIVEVGPGTGQATKDLLARGAWVHAIEIGPAMATKLCANYASEHLRVSVADFEVLDIEPASADAVFSATAYHWISRGAQTDRPGTFLRPGGLVAIVDLIQVDSADDLGFFAAAQPIYERVLGAPHRPPGADTRTRSIHRSATRWKLIVGSTASLSLGTTGTRRTAPPTTASSCCRTPARR